MVAHGRDEVGADGAHDFGDRAVVVDADAVADWVAVVVVVVVVVVAAMKRSRVQIQ